MCSKEEVYRALSALQSHTSSSTDRKSAEQWLLSFQKSDDGWDIAKQLIQETSTPADVQLFASQSLKTKARLCRAAQNVCRHLQNDLLGVLQSNSHVQQKSLAQLCLAFVAVTLPILDGLQHVLQDISQTLPLRTCLMILELLADEAFSLMPFGPGSIEERADLVTAIKHQLRAHSNSVFGWLAQACDRNQQQQQQQEEGRQSQPSGASASAEDAAAILRTFNAWVKLGGLHDMPQQQAQSLISLALVHLRQPQSPAFESAGDALADVVDHCPEGWLGALHDTMMGLTDVAVNAASTGHAAAAEKISKVVSSFGALSMSLVEVGTDARNRAVGECLMRLALLTQINPESGDPVSWPALEAWTHMTEAVVATGDGYDCYAEAYYGDANEDSMEHGAGGAEGSGFQTATEYASQHAAALSSVPEAVQKMYEQLAVGLLSNLVGWHQTPGPEAEVAVEGFTPTFMAAMEDCLGAVCGVLGPHRFTMLLWMMMDTPAPTVAPAIAAAAMGAVAAAGGRKLTSDPAALEVLASIMLKASHMSLKGTSWLVPLCCAAAVAGKHTLVFLHKKGMDAQGFLVAMFERALKGVTHPDDSLDVRNPAALAIKGLMQGSLELGLEVPLSCVSALVQAIQQQAQQDTAPEQALVLALSAAVCSVHSAQSRQRVELEALQQLLSPIHGVLVKMSEQLKAVGWSQLSGAKGYDEELARHLNRLSMLLESTLQQRRRQQQVHGCNDKQESQDSFSWLCHAFATQLWPPAQAAMAAGACGTFVQPLCRCITAILRAQHQQLNEVLAPMLQALSSCMFRPGGRQAHEPLAAAMELLSGGGSAGAQGLQLVQQTVHSVLSQQRVTQLRGLGAGDQEPELAEAVIKVASAYVKHSLLGVAAQDVEAACTTLSAIASVAAACSCSNHRQVAMTALQSLSAVVAVARAVVAAGSGGRAGGDAMLRTVLDNGNMIVTGLLGAMLSASPLPRLQKITAAFTDLACLTSTAAVRGMVGQQQGSGSNGHDAGSQPSVLLSSWLTVACQQFQLQQDEQQRILQSWPGALQEAANEETAAAAANTGQASHGVGRHLKKVLRDFAELHSRDQ